jgi:hypothetical protein
LFLFGDPAVYLSVYLETALLYPAVLDSGTSIIMAINTLSVVVGENMCMKPELSTVIIS